MKSIGVINMYKLHLNFYLSLFVLQHFGEEKNKPGYLQRVCWVELAPERNCLILIFMGWVEFRKEQRGRKIQSVAPNCSDYSRH